MLKRLIFSTFLFIVYSSHAYSIHVQNSQDSILDAGLKALENKQVILAISLRHQLKSHSLNSDILCWAIALAGLKNTPSQELGLAIENLPSWPNQNSIKANYERVAYNEIINNKPNFKKNHDLKPYISPTTAKNFVAYFNKNPPKTTQGMAIYIASAIISKDLDEAMPRLRTMWLHKILNTDEQNIILATSGNLLSPIDHVHRLKMLLLHRSYDSAMQIAWIIHAQKITKLFTKIVCDKKYSKAKLKELKKSDNYSVLYQYAYIHKCIDQHNFKEAADRLLKLSQASSYLVCPNIWAHLHLSLAHDLIYNKQANLAYKILNIYRNKNNSRAADREFYAGWIALRRLYKPNIAIKHFINIIKYNKNKASIAKTYYWVARCYEYSGRKKSANAYYKKSANFNNSFYGQLSAAKLPKHKPKIIYPGTNLREQETFNAIEAVQALKKLQNLNDKKYSRLLSLALAQNLKTVGHLAFLASIESSYGDYYAALKIAKIASKRGFEMGALTHPLGAIEDSSKLSLNEKAMIYAIARQESEFNTHAISKVGARGLMQLMPRTAQELSKRLMQKFSLRKLLSSTAYNAKLGSELLRKHLKYFKGSYLLTFAAYNAGKTRIKQWMEKYGDPRILDLYSVIDWIENIPYSETRNYTKRIFENYEIYKSILVGYTSINKDLCHK